MVKKAGTTTKTRATRTKEELNSELSEVQSRVASAEVGDPKALEAARARTAEVKQMVKDISVDGALQSVGKVNLEVSKLFSSVSEALIQQAKHLETVTEAVALMEAELEGLHGKDVAASSLTALLAEFEAKQNDLKRLKAESEEAWKREVANHEKLAKEQRDEQLKQRAREQQEYDYTTQKTRAKAQDDFNDKMAAQEKQQREKGEQLLKSWTEREKSLAAREAELADLKKQVENFPARLTETVSKEVATALAAQKMEHDFKVQLATKDAYSQNALANQRIGSLEAAKSEQAATIDNLQKQLAEAKKQVTDIATKALDSASGAVALERVTSFSRNNDSNVKAKP